MSALIGLIYFMTAFSGNNYNSVEYYTSYKIYFIYLGIGIFKHIFSYWGNSTLDPSRLT